MAGQRCFKKLTDMQGSHKDLYSQWTFKLRQLGQNLREDFFTKVQAKFAKTVPEHFEGLSYLVMKFKTQRMFSDIFIHIIQLSLFSNEYLPIAGKR